MLATPHAGRRASIIRDAACATTSRSPKPHLSRARVVRALVAAPVARRARTASPRSAPLVSVLLFLAAIISAFWYLRNEEFEREQEAVKRDTEVAQQRMRLRLIENQEQLMRIAREIATRHDRPRGLPAAGRRRSRASTPRSRNLIWVDANALRDRQLLGARAFRAETGISGDDTPASLPVEGSAQRARASPSPRARDLQQTGVFAAVRRQLRQRRCSRCTSRCIDRSNVRRRARSPSTRSSGLLRYFVPAEVANRHAIALLDGKGRSLASTGARRCPATSAAKRPSIVYEVPVSPVGNGLVLRGQALPHLARR